VALWNNQKKDSVGPDWPPEVVLTFLALAVAMILVVTVMPLAVAWVTTGHSGHLTGSQMWHAIMGGLRAKAFPAAFRWRLPHGADYWLMAALIAAVPVSFVVAAGHRIRIVMSMPVTDKRWWSLRGRSPREFARWGTIARLTVRRPSPGRHIVGRYQGALVACEPMVHIALIAPTGAGKTSAEIVPFLLEHRGPALNVSTKTDVIRDTIKLRQQLGSVYVWDPFGATQPTDPWEPSKFTPLNGCETFHGALQVAKDLDRARVGGADTGQSSTERFFGDRTQDLTGPLMWAARVGGYSIVDVLNWVRNFAATPIGQQAGQPPAPPDAPLKVLTDIRTADAQDAIDRLLAVHRTEPRQRDSIVGTAMVQLACYGNPLAATSATGKGEYITPEALIAGPGRNTLYIVASREQQELLAPIVVLIVASVQRHAAELEQRTGEPLTPPLLMALDETGTAAPLKDLPAQTSVGRSAGVQYVTSWQTLAQLYRVYGEYGGAEILTNSACKLVLGPIEDDKTRAYVVGALGRHQMVDGEHAIHNTRDVATAQALRTARPTDALLLHSGYPAAPLKQRRAHEDRLLRRLKEGQLERDKSSSRVWGR